MSFHCKQIREKYVNFLEENNIVILSDIFERMDLNRRINDALRQLQQTERLTNKQMIEKRKFIFRKLARKVAVHLYTKDGGKSKVERHTDKESKHRALKEIKDELFNKKRMSACSD